MNNLIRLFLVALILFSNAALAKQKNLSTEIPTTIRNSIDQPFLIGATSLRFLGAKVYDISLWSEGREFSYNKNFAIHIKYNMSFGREELAQRSIDEIERLHKLNQEEKASYLENLKIIFHSVKKGDEKLAVFTPSKGVAMFYNGDLIGKISDPKLSRLFVDIWLDERGSYPEVTNRILGKF
jgi:hypothetical protein